MAWMARSRRLAFVFGLAAAASCGADDDADWPGVGESGSDDEEQGNGSGPILDAGATRRDAGRAPSDKDDLAPEIEQPLAFETPQAGKTSVYVPDPATNRIAVVNASNFKVENINVGTQPRYAVTVPGEDIALALNVGTKDAALLRTDAQGVTSSRRLDVGHDANAIAIAPDKQHALIFFNASLSTTTRADSFQDLTVIDLEAGKERSRRVSVGFKPRGVQFTSDGKRAFVITEDGISVLDFAALDTGPKILPLVTLGDSLSDAQSIDVQVTPDGAFALARRNGESVLRLIELATGKIETLELAGADADGGVGGELTDLDLSPEGSPNGVFAIAVLRDRGVLVRIPIPAGFRDASTRKEIPNGGALIGSVTLSRSGTRAIGYTTAAPIESVTVFDLGADVPPRGIRLRKSVRAVALSDDGSRALVLHATQGTLVAGQDEDARIDASEGYSLVDTGSGFAKLQLTAVRPNANGLLLTPDGKRVFTLLAGGNVKTVEMADLDSFQVTSRELSTQPSSIGFVPGSAEPRVFVGQTGNGGITFLNALTGVPVRTVSGFEIASRIRQ
jgi:DNA-binding beta-propeller fold protein YncE